MTPEQVVALATKRYGAVPDEELVKQLAAAKDERAAAQRKVAEIKHVIKYRKRISLDV